MSVDFHELLWQQLNKSFAKGTDQAFVMSIGKSLLYSDYSLTSGNEQVAVFNTFTLTDSCVACGANYNPTGSKISVLWDTLLNHGKGPQAGPEQQAAFEQARKSLFKVWDSRTPTPFYQSYLDANNAYQMKRLKMKIEYQKEYGDQWEAIFDEAIKATPEYQTYERLYSEVAPMLKDINEWIYGPLADTLVPMKKAFDDNTRTDVDLPGKGIQSYMYVSMIPSNWYQWFDRGQPDDPAWITITVNEHSKDDFQSKEYRKLVTESSGGSWFLSVSSKTTHTEKKNFQTADSRDVQISFKVRSVEINRPWVDPSALKIQKWEVPGLAPGAWSTGVLDKSNTGSFPLLTTQLIVAKDIKVTASKFSQEIIDTLNKFETSTQVGVLGGLFSFGSYSEHTDQYHSFHFDEKGSTLTLPGAQVIGYTGTLMPKYAV